MLFCTLAQAKPLRYISHGLDGFLGNLPGGVRSPRVAERAKILYANSHEWRFE
jgi:hypothetical protein